MSLSPEQLELRKNRIGASEIGAVLGIDPYRSPLQLWMDKKGLSRPRDAEHMGWGLDVEQAILRNFARTQGYEILPAPGSLKHPFLPLVATPDGLVLHKGKVRNVQCKNVEEHHSNKWGDPGTAQAPLFYVAQVQVELGVLRETECRPDLAPDDEGDLAVSFGGRPPKGYPIPFNEELFGNLADAADRFVRDHLETDKPPPVDGDKAALEYVKRRWRTSTGELLEPTAEAMELVNQLRIAKAESSADESVVEQLQAKLCNLIGGALGFEGWCTWSVVKEQRANVTDWLLLLEELSVARQIPRLEVQNLIDKHTREEIVKESYRRLSLAKERKGK